MERRFMGSRKAKMWTYLIFGIVIIIGVLIANFAFDNPELARNGVDAFLGLPNWAFPSIVFVVGAFIFWLGLKMETDWPEFFGAFLIGSAIVAAEIMLGWEKFQLGGITVIPYILPPLVFLVLIIVGMVKSK